MFAMKNHFLSALAIAGAASALTVSPDATQSGCYYHVANIGAFNTYMSHDWSTGAFSQDVSDLNASTYTVNAGNSPYARRFDVANIGASTSPYAVTLSVPGGQTSGPISVSQITTAYDDILYGSVRTIAMISNVPGTTHGFSFYSSDTQEVDFAFITSDISVAHITNEQTSDAEEASSYTVKAPSDAATAWHEYRLDWTSNATYFYIDGTLVYNITDNVPSQPGFWLWNNWSNGNSWAAGPPAKDSVLKIRGIEAYFNRTSVATGSASCAVASSTTSKTSSSTAKAATTTSSSSSTKAATTTTSTAAASTCSSGAPQQSAYGQCGGINWTGATCCVSGWTCQYQNDFYYQCVQSTATSTTSSSAQATTTTTSSKTSSTTTAKTSTTAAASTSKVAAYGQCGGYGYSGSTTCVSGYTCTYMNYFYSQCV